MQRAATTTTVDLASDRRVPPRTGPVRLLARLRWWLPVGLAVLALVVEWAEHLGEAEAITAWFLGELVVFAVLGPVAVWFTLAWVARLVGRLGETSAQLAAANERLEASVADRTRHLREATRQLELTNADLARANQDLRELDGMKSEFVSLVSHQLRAPLTNIVGALEMVSGDAAALPPASQRTLQILTLESQRLSRLIQRILDVSRLEAGRLRLHLGPVALEPLLARVAETTLGVAGETPWRLAVPSGLPPVWADEQLVGEVVRNLLENGVRYAPPGCPIVVDAQRRGDILEIGVSDEGVGVPPEEQARIFGSFHRVGDADTVIAGHGLGLYFAERLIRAQHGTIGVESPLRPGTNAPGSRFWVRLPIAAGGPDEDDDAPWLDDTAEVPDTAQVPDTADPTADERALG